MRRPTLGVAEAQPYDSFILDIDLYLKIFRPKDYHVFREEFNPSNYFVTSGDAIRKTKRLLKDLQIYKSEIIAYIEAVEPEKSEEIRIALEKQLGEGRRLLQDLITAKGENCFLETEWDNHTLLVIAKNPRTR